MSASAVSTQASIKSDWHKLVPVISSGHMPHSIAYKYLPEDRFMLSGDQVYIRLETYQGSPKWYQALIDWAVAAYGVESVSVVCFDPDGCLISDLKLWQW